VKAASTLIVLACCCPPAAPADTVQLKDKTAVVGKILAEKRDQVAVDIGFTVLLIPRDQIVAIVRSESPEPAAKPLASPKAAAEIGSPPLPRAREKSVQVQAPSGATLIIRGEATSQTMPLELKLPAGTYTLARTGEAPLEPGAPPRLELEGARSPAVDLQKPLSASQPVESGIGNLIRLCLAEADRIDLAGREGRFFIPAAARSTKAEWEDWRRSHQVEFDLSPELRKAWLGVIRAINLNTPGAI
jgi:hypothetical protein